MVEQPQYISSGLPHAGDLAGHHGLPEDRTSLPPATSAYPDITPYSAVSSFNLPAQCDSSLLTPISTAASPPLHQVRKLAPQYPPPPSTPYTQVPTPPGSSKMYHQWNNQFDMNSQSSQANSPMNSQGPVAQEFYTMPDERRTPVPPEAPYMGSYSVSEGPETQPIHHQGPSYYLDVSSSMDNPNSMMIRDSPSMPIDQHHRGVDRNAPLPAPLLSHPHPHAAHYRPVRRPSMDEHIHGNHLDPTRRSPSDSPRRRPTQGNTRIKKHRPSSKRQQASLRNSSQVDPASEHKNCYGEETPPKLKPTCPDEERCIFASRWQHRNQRGQDMWDSIQRDFQQKFNKHHGKEMLQMKFKRGRSKYLEWLPRDEELIRKAWRQVEKDRYQNMLEIFLELGGSRNMLLSASDIEIKVVNDLKLEEPLYIEVGDLELRRRRRAINKKRSGGRGEQGGDVTVPDELLSVSPRTTHTEDDVVNQVYGRRDARWDEDSSTTSEIMDVQMWDSRAPMKMEPGVMVPQGEHMARQACDQLLKVHNASNVNGNTHTHTNGHPIGGPAAQSMYHHRSGH